MSHLFSIDWQAVWIPSCSITETILRGSLLYLAMIAVLRLLRRETGALGITDVLLVVLIGDAAQNAMAAEHRSVTDGIILITTIAGWDYGLDWLSYRIPAVRRLLRPAPLLLIKDGRIMLHNMRQELVTREELLSQLRQHGVDGIKNVRKCYFEGDGHFSVITFDSPAKPQTKPADRVPGS